MFRRLVTKIGKFRRDERGGMTVVVVGFVMVLIILALVMLESMRYSESYYEVEIAIQRALNGAVEQNMDYRNRADKILYLYIDAAPPVERYEAGIRPGQGAWIDFLDALENALGASRSGTTFQKTTASGETAYVLTITSHSGTDRVASTAPYMTVTGEITMWPMFGGFGDTPITTTFTYTSKNFRID